ncbi:1693_t:CDS:2, partial [Paraglomus brasilianum]
RPKTRRLEPPWLIHIGGGGAVRHSHGHSGSWCRQSRSGRSIRLEEGRNCPRIRRSATALVRSWGPRYQRLGSSAVPRSRSLKRSEAARDFTSLGRTSRRNGSGNAPLNQRECKFDGYYDTSELCNKDKARRTQKSQAEAPGGAEPVRRQPVRPPAVAGAPTLRRGGPGAWLREHGPLRLSP